MRLIKKLKLPYRIYAQKPEETETVHVQDRRLFGAEFNPYHEIEVGEFGTKDVSDGAEIYEILQLFKENCLVRKTGFRLIYNDIYQESLRLRKEGKIKEYQSDLKGSQIGIVRSR